MLFFKKYWYLFLVALFTLGLGAMVYITSQQLATTKEVAPTVPQAEPQAVEPACKLAFAIDLGTTPTPTPTPTPGSTNTPTPTPTLTPTTTQIVYVNPTLTPTPVQQVGCNSACAINTDCSGGLVCVDGFCRNPSCTGEVSCVCPVAVVQPTPKTPVSGGPTILGVSAIGMGMLILILGLAL